MIELEVPTRSWPSYQTSIDNKPSETWKGEAKGGRFAGSQGEFIENEGEKPNGLRREASD
jgi:hypothetical protein